VRGADASRFEKRDAVCPHWEKQLFPGTVTTHSQRKPLKVVP
jgi:hypothetical protein